MESLCQEVTFIEEKILFNEKNWTHAGCLNVIAALKDRAAVSSGCINGPPINYYHEYIILRNHPGSCLINQSPYSLTTLCYLKSYERFELQ